MHSSEPIIVIEDDREERELIDQAIRELGVSNPIRFFERAPDALYYLMDTREHPQVILCDINLPGMDGLDLRRRINESHYLHHKSIPFVFLTNSELEEDIIRAYDLLVQGYFVKPDSLEGLKEIISQVLSYWTRSLHPNNFLKFQARASLQRRF
ncbi:MAG: response regulator [Chitinophagaceae bacterium]|nr:MAG: response regulator [Chitinophagaceae bacterium]